MVNIVMRFPKIFVLTCTDLSNHENRLEICQKFHTTGFYQKFYKQKMCEWGLILLTIKQRKFQYK